MLSRSQARRVTLAAQGFRDSAHTRPTMRTFSRALARTVVLQIDSVNVLQRAHYMPLYSRMGPYDIGLLGRASEQRPRRVVEYWAHVAAFMPVELWPLMAHRMRRYREHGHPWLGAEDRAALAASLLAEVRERGPSTARDLDDGLPRVRDHWGWNWSQTKRVLEHLFVAGDLAVTGRNAQFERRFDLPERVLPPYVLATATPTDAEAHVELVRRAAIAHGVGTEPCLRDYFRMRGEDSRVAVATLVETGELVPVRVEGWDRQAYLHRDAALPRDVHARALLSPFDPVVWERTRTEKLFGFHYRIEIYVPEPQRTYGYYVLPFLLGDELVGRVDLKADRRAAGGQGRLRVLGAYSEPDAPCDAGPELAAELRTLARWLGLAGVVIADRGDLAPVLVSELR